MSKLNFYKIEFKKTEKNEYIYPKVVNEAIWKRTIYHYENEVMIGGTEQQVRADGKEIVALTPEEAENLMKDFAASYPEIKEPDFEIERQSK